MQMEMKEKIIDAYRWATLPARMWAKRKAINNGSYPVMILFYHRVADHDMNPWTISRAGFDAQISWLSKNFDLVSLDEAQRRIRFKQNTRPTLSITFDDGYAENSEHAIPLLIKRKIPVTYFITSENIFTGKPFPHDAERKRPLDVNVVESIKAMAAAGVDIGAHTKTHPDLGKIQDPEVLKDEVINSANELQSALGIRLRYFAFPFGQISNLNQLAYEMCVEHGFEGVCSAYGGYNEIGEDGYHLQRIHGDPSLSRIKNWLTFDPRLKRGTRYRFIEPVSLANQVTDQKPELVSN